MQAWKRHHGVALMFLFGVHACLLLPKVKGTSAWRERKKKLMARRRNLCGYKHFPLDSSMKKKEGGKGEKEQGSINEIILTCTWF